MPNDCPACCRALEQIEGLVIQIEKITAKDLPNGEQRDAVAKTVKSIVRISREARDAECREG